MFGFVRTGVDYGPLCVNLSQLRSYGSALAAVAVVLTTRVTGDLRLLRILVIDQPCDGGGFRVAAANRLRPSRIPPSAECTGGAVSSVRAQSRRQEPLSEAPENTSIARGPTSTGRPPAHTMKSGDKTQSTSYCIADGRTDPMPYAATATQTPRQ